MTYTRDHFVIDLRHCGLSQIEFAARLGLTEGTVHHWGGGRTPFPRWVPLLLAAWRDNRVLRASVAELAPDKPAAS